MSSKRKLHLVLLLLSSVGIGMQSAALAAEDKLYYFIDERGVPHISNAPSDPRYKPFNPDKPIDEPPDASTRDEHTPAPDELEPPAVETFEPRDEHPPLEVLPIEEQRPENAR